MRPTSTVLGVTAACAACCALPILAPMLAAVGLAGLGTTAAGWAVGIALLALAVAVGLIVRRRVAASACAVSKEEGQASGPCGCGSVPTSAR